MASKQIRLLYHWLVWSFSSNSWCYVRYLSQYLRQNLVNSKCNNASLYTVFSALVYWSIHFPTNFSFRGMIRNWSLGILKSTQVNKNDLQVEWKRNRILVMAVTHSENKLFTLSIAATALTPSSKLNSSRRVRGWFWLFDFILLSDSLTGRDVTLTDNSLGLFWIVKLIMSDDAFLLLLERFPNARF